MYKRHEGDNLLSNDSRLKYAWKWSRGGSGISHEELKKWTHFQISYSEVDDGWELEAIQWSRGQTVCYEAVINFNHNKIASINEFSTRILAEIGAEELLHDWIELQYELIRMEEAQAKLDKIDSWINAYPLEVFPEPDFKKAAKVLKANDMTLDAISASNMRHVLNGISEIIKA